uniref:Reverse transcriptase domain-containing protein n=1 Tax=Oryzias latipes TaxID=8090 RepID=A0A3P9JCY3_ORYLA
MAAGDGPHPSQRTVPPGLLRALHPRSSGRGGGGLAVVYRDISPCSKLRSDSFSSFELQITKVGSDSPFYCILIYRPPGPARVFLDEFAEFLSGIINFNSVLIMGDFNIHIDDSSCASASELLFITESFNLIQHVSVPTHDKGHTLDLVFSLGLDIKQLRVKDSHISDHCWIFFSVISPRPSLPTPVRMQRRILSQNVSDRFTDLFDANSFNHFNDVDSFMYSFNSHCETILNTIAPVRQSVSSKKSFPWINAEIHSFRRLCRKIERLWKITKLEVHRLHLKELISTLNGMIKQARSTFFHNLISMNKRNPKTLFNTIYTLTSPSSSQLPNLSQSDCSTFLQTFSARISDVGHNIPPLVSAPPPPSPQFSQTWSNFSPVTVEDIHSLLNKIKPSSCPLDIIPTPIFLKVFECIGAAVVDLINLSLMSGSVPSFLKHAIINPVLKKPNLDHSDQNNFRPISKLPFIAKILEKVVAEQLRSFLEQNNICDIFQSGFKKNHSTETALLKVSNDVLMAADSGQYTVLILLDLKSAFDTVNHEIMLERLHNNYGLSGSVLNWFVSYFSGRSYKVCVNSLSSEAKILSCGVPQGSVLGPILFTLYMIPLGRLISKFSNISYHLYADDIQLYCSFGKNNYTNLSNLLDCLASIRVWLNDNHLLLNPNKTETIIFAPDDKIPSIKSHLGSLSSSVQPSLRNLGVWFDKAMSLDSHSKRLVKNCFYHLRNVAKLKTMLTRSDLELIIHAFISSRLDYCNSLFTCFNKKSLKRLQLVQNSAARLLTGTNKRTHTTLCFYLYIGFLLNLE